MIYITPAGLGPTTDRWLFCAFRVGIGGSEGDSDQTQRPDRVAICGAVLCVPGGLFGRTWPV